MKPEKILDDRSDSGDCDPVTCHRLRGMHNTAFVDVCHSGGLIVAEYDKDDNGYERRHSHNTDDDQSNSRRVACS